MKEKPTDIHHIKLEKEKAAAVGAPHMCAETIEEESGWPWWWWIPLLLCCCLIPLCIGLLYFCKKKPAPKPKPAPRAPVKAAPKPKEVKAKPKEEIVAVPQKKYVYEKHKVNQEDEIEREITKELQRSKLRQAERKSNVIQHNPRYVESDRYAYEGERVSPYRREATYDVVGRTTQEVVRPVADAYIVQRRPEEIVRVVERKYDAGATSIVSPREVGYRKSASRKSFVNPNYREDILSSGRDDGIHYEVIRTTNQPINTSYREMKGSTAIGKSPVHREVHRESMGTKHYDDEVVRNAGVRGNVDLELDEDGHMLRKQSYASNQQLRRDLEKQMKYERDNVDVDYKEYDF